MGGGFGSDALWIHCLVAPVNYIIIDPIFHIAGRIGRTENSLLVGFVLGKKQRWRSFAIKKPLAQFRMRSRDDAHTMGSVQLPEQRLGHVSLRGPRVAEPQRRQ